MIRHEKVSAWNVPRLLLRSTLCGAGAGRSGCATPPSPPPSPSPQLSHPIIGPDRNTNLQAEVSNQASHGVLCSGHFFAGARSPKVEPTATDFLRDALSMHHLRDRRAKPTKTARLARSARWAAYPFVDYWNRIASETVEQPDGIVIR